MRFPYFGTQFFIFLLIANEVKAAGSGNHSVDSQPPGFHGIRIGIVTDAGQNEEAQSEAVATVAAANPPSEQGKWGIYIPVNWLKEIWEVAGSKIYHILSKSFLKFSIFLSVFRRKI
jgi:hypothetical protein